MFSMTKTMMKSQKGAMFGLDARVALAIFAGLSVIAGAAVFGTIRQTNVTALTTEFDNISKGYINYVFDTGTDTTVYSDLLVDPAVPGVVNWNGPYLTSANNSHQLYGEYSLVEGGEGTGATPVACSTGNLCFAWLSLDEVPTAIAEEVDKVIDGEQSATEGNFRYNNNSGASVVFYKLSRCQRPGTCTR